MGDLPTLVYCVDEQRTKIAEDGYQIVSDERTHLITIVAVAVTPEKLDTDALYRTLGKSKEDRYKVNKKMFPTKYIFDHNLQHENEVPAIIVHFEIEMGNYSLDEVTLHVTLGNVKRTKQLTYPELSWYGISPHNSSFKENMNLIRRLTTENSQLSFEGSPPQSSMAMDFVWKLLRIYNYACTEACIRNKIPYVGREVLDAYDGDLQTFGTFNCPLRHPKAAINNINLSYFLKHGHPFFSEKDIENILATARKTPVM